MPKLYRDAATGQYTTAEDAAARPAETVAETVDERVDAWEAIAKHAAFLACYDDERPLLVSMLTRLDELTVTESHLSELLCDLTGGRLSKPTYPVSVMVQEVEDYFERTAESVPAHHETPDVAELRRLLAGASPLPWRWEPPFGESWPLGDGSLVTTSGDPVLCDRALIAAAVNALPGLLGKADALLDAADRLAHMTEARNNARAEVKRLAAMVEAVRALHFEDTFLSGACNECETWYPCDTIRALDGEHLQ